MMLSVDKMTVLVGIFSELIMCQIIWGDISVIEMRFSPLSPPGAVRRRWGRRRVYTGRYSEADKERYLAQNKQNKILPLTVNDIYINQVLLTTFQQVETSTLSSLRSAPQTLIVLIKYLFSKVNDCIMLRNYHDQSQT